MLRSLQEWFDILYNDGPYPVFFTLTFLLGGVTGNVMLGVTALFYTVYLLCNLRDKGYIVLPDKKEIEIWILFFLGASFTMVWGIDKGESFIGLLHVCSMFLFRLTYLQLPDRCRCKVIELLPDIGVAMTLLAALLSLVPACKDLFIEGGRLAGTFQYANTYGLFILLGIGVLHHVAKGRQTFIYYLILAMGLYLSGSRTIWLLYICMEVWFLLTGYHFDIRVILCAVLLPAAIVITSVYIGLDSPAGRFMTIGAMESTFLGRLLYVADAIPMLSRYPLGMGYMGYFYLQQAMQTGVYRVRFVHNDILQIGLDFGIPILVIFLGCITKAFLDKGKPKIEKELLAVILMGSLFDFHLQYQSLMWLLIMLLCDGGGKKIHIRMASPKGIFALFAGILTSLVFLLNAAGQAAYLAGEYDTACRIAFWNSDAQLYRMLSQNTLDESAACAEKIVMDNPYQKEAHQILAYYYMMEKDYLKMADEYEKVLSLDHYNESAYDEYSWLLIDAETQCREEGRDSEGLVMMDKLSKINDMKEDAIRNTSYLAYLIDDKPKLCILEEDN